MGSTDLGRKSICCETMHNALSINFEILACNTSIISKHDAKSTVYRWEDPEDYNALGEKAYEGASGEDRAHRNLRRFGEAHIIPASPWKEGEKVESMGGGQVWWENKDGNRVVCSREHHRFGTRLTLRRSNLGTSKSPV